MTVVGGLRGKFHLAVVAKYLASAYITWLLRRVVTVFQGWDLPRDQLGLIQIVKRWTRTRVLPVLRMVCVTAWLAMLAMTVVFPLRCEGM